MANFCTKCGASLTEGVKFCTKCGAAAGGEAPVATPPPAPAAAPPASVPTAAPAARPVAPGGSGALKVVLIVIAVFVGLGILGSLVAGLVFWRVSRSITVDPSGGQVSISTPGGKVSVGTPQRPVTEAELGVPIYPGAKQQEGAMQITSEEGSMHTYVFKTSDSPQQVMAFYREKLGTESASYVETPEGGMITSSKGKKEGFWITIGTDEGETVITIMHGHSMKAPQEPPTQPQ